MLYLLVPLLSTLTHTPLPFLRLMTLSFRGLSILIQTCSLHAITTLTELSPRDLLLEDPNKGIFLNHRSNHSFLLRNLFGLPGLGCEIRILSMGFWIPSWSSSSQASFVLSPLILLLPLMN